MTSEQKSFLEDLGLDPWHAFESWYSAALKIDTPNPNTMTLATADKKGNPACRTLLLKEWIREQGFVFFTNYTSAKSLALFENPKAELHFYWDSLFLQIRIFGEVNKTAPKVSEDYFHSRGRDKQLAAWASKQSSTMKKSSDLEDNFNTLTKKFEGEDIPLPDFWGGWILKPLRFEFWRGSSIRMHERAAFKLDGNRWESELLYP